MKQIFCYRNPAGDPPDPGFGNVLVGIDNWGNFESSNAYLMGNVILQACTLRSFYQDIDDAPGIGNTRTNTIRKNASNTAVSLVFSGATTALQDTTHELTFADGDIVTISTDSSGTPASINRIFTSFELETPNSKVCQYFSGALTLDSNPATVYRGLFNGTGQAGAAFDNDVDKVADICPINGQVLEYAFYLMGRGGSILDGSMCLMKRESGSGVWVAQDGTGGTPDTSVNLMIAPNDIQVFRSDPFVMDFSIGDEVATRLIVGANTHITGSFTVRAASELDGESMWCVPAYPSPTVLTEDYATTLFTTGSAPTQWFPAESAVIARALPGAKFALDHLIGRTPTTLGSGVTRTISVRNDGVTTPLSISIVAPNTDYVRNPDDIAYFTNSETISYITTAGGGTPNSVPMRLALRQTVAAVITVVKVTDPADDPQSFDFTSDTLFGNFSLAGGESVEILTSPGTFAFGETLPSGWELVSAISSNGDPVSAVEAEANDLITLTFTNAQATPTAGSLVISKLTNPPGSLQPFDFQITGGLDPGTFALLSGESRTYLDVPIGTYTILETLPAGWNRVSATVSNDSPLDGVTVGAGEAVTVLIVNAQIPPTPPATLNGTLLRLRRLRRTPHLNNEKMRMFYRRLELDVQTGVGLPEDVQGQDPQAMLRWSDDGGRTWSNEHWEGVGRLGRYSERVWWANLGSGRDRVFEMVVSDPVAWRIINCYLKIEKGSS